MAINLDRHLCIDYAMKQDYSTATLEEALSSLADTPFPEGVPPWKITVYPLQEEWLIAFSFSHALGDGIFGKAFHRTFSRAFTDGGTASKAITSIVRVPQKQLPPPFDTPERLPMSWSYLISSSIAYLIPSLLGRRASASTLDIGTWLGAPIAITPTKMRIREVSADTLFKALRAARAHDAKLTGLFQHLVARALSKHLPPDPSITNFVSATAVNMRKAVGVSDDQGGLYTSGCAITRSRQDTSSIQGALTGDDWGEISSATRSLAEAWRTTQDQFIGLLKYLPSIRKRLATKEGTRRSCSFQVSNIGVFETCDHAPEESHEMGQITDVIFATPGEVIGGALKFTLIRLKGGNMTYVVSWRKGALDLGERDEGEFVHTICKSIEKDLRQL